MVLDPSMFTSFYSLSNHLLLTRWTYGADRVQLNADIKVVSEFSSFLQTDAVRGLPTISSLSPLQTVSRISCKYPVCPVVRCALIFLSDYNTRLRDLNVPMRLLVESELSRLSVWVNPMNDTKRSTDFFGATERGLVDATWLGIIRTVWNVDPAIAVFLTERFKLPLLRNEVGRLVRSSPKDVLAIPEAVHFFLGDRFDPYVRRDLKVFPSFAHPCWRLQKISVSPFMGASAPDYCHYFFRTAVQQSTSDTPICTPRVRRTPRRLDLLLRPPSCTNTPLRYTR